MFVFDTVLNFYIDRFISIPRYTLTVLALTRTLAKIKTREKKNSQERYEESKGLWLFPLTGVVLLLPLLFDLLSLSSAQKSRLNSFTMIYVIHELTLCYAVMIQCSLNFFGAVYIANP